MRLELDREKEKFLVGRTIRGSISSDSHLENEIDVCLK